MPDVFISHKSQEVDSAGRVRQALKKAIDGCDVFWQEDLQAGGKWEETLDNALIEAKCVVVLWSERSVESQWVVQEAAVARAFGKLIPAKIDNCSIPAPYRGIITVDLRGWKESKDEEKKDGKQFARLTTAVRAQIAATSTSTHPLKADVVVVCALYSPELEKLEAATGTTWIDHNVKGDPNVYKKTVLKTDKDKDLVIVAASPNQMGMAASGILATKMIMRFKPTLVAMVGIAAGVRPDHQGFGDILCPQHTFDYDSGKRVSDDEGNLVLRPDPHPLSINAGLKNRLLQWKNNRTPFNAIKESWPGNKPPKELELHVGPVGSGAAVIDEPKATESIRDHWRKLAGIEMEAHGVHLACENTLSPAPPFLCAKSICDFAEGKTDHYQLYAAFTSAQFLIRFLKAEWETTFAHDH